MDADRQALQWIVELLERVGVPCQAVGGLAARAYGARRPLVDFDFYVPNARLADIAAAAAPHVVRAPGRHRDSHWNLVFMKLVHGSRKIELGGADDAQFYDTRAGCWRHAGIDFARSVERSVLGVTVPTMPLQQLVDYKRALGRHVDHADLSEIALAMSM